MQIGHTWQTGFGIVGLALTAACSDIFGPKQAANPELQQLIVDDLFTNLREGGLIYIDGLPASTGFRLKSGQRVPVEVAVSSGDRENAGLYRQFCPFTDRVQFGHFDCFRFTIYMQMGLDVRTLAGRVTAMKGRYDLISATGWIGGVTLFSPEDLVAHARSARSWPGVAFVRLSSVACAPGSLACGSSSALEVPLPVDTGAAVLGDGILQVRSGDIVVVSYHQPSGSTLQAVTVVP